MATRAESLRILVAEYDAEGVSPATIGGRLGISVARVEEILDQLDESDGRPAHQDDEQRAPAVEPVRPEPRPVAGSGPIVVGSPARAPSKPKPVDVHPVPDWPDETTYRPTYLGPVEAPAPRVLAEPASPPLVMAHPAEGVDRMAPAADIEWSDPPARRHRGAGLDPAITATIEQLKKNPGRWAAVAKGMRASSAYATWKKRGCEAVSRREESAPGAPARWTVYARWPA